MAITERPVVVGVFADNAEAERAITALQHAGFDNNQIKFSVQRGAEGILDGLVGMGLPYSEAGFYNREFFAGRSIVVVMSADRRQEAYNILRSFGSYDSSRHADAAPPPKPPAEAGPENRQTLQLSGEVLQVQKYWAQSEEIRIHRRVITEEKVFKIPVSREEVTIERVPLNPDARPANPQDGQNPSLATGIGQVAPPAGGETMKIPIREERVSFQKMPFVIEEITLTKRVVQETKRIAATVQREQAHIERVGNARVEGDHIDEALPSE
jgi:uncharacterized protein (TIGR02271 family)